MRSVGKLHPEEAIVILDGRETRHNFPQDPDNVRLEFPEHVEVLELLPAIREADRIEFDSHTGNGAVGKRVHDPVHVKLGELTLVRGAGLCDQMNDLFSSTQEICGDECCIVGNVEDDFRHDCSEFL